MARKKKESPEEMVMMQVRMKRELRDSFNAVIRNKDLSGAQVIRELMRRYIRDNDQIELDL